MLLYVLVIVTLVLVLVPHIAVQQLKRLVLATVTFVLVLVQHIAVLQMLRHVQATVMSVLVLAQHITVQEVMVFAQVLLDHVTVQVVAQYGIVSHVLTLMVYADIQLVAVILAATHMIMVLPAQPVKFVVVGHVVVLFQTAHKA